MKQKKFDISRLWETPLQDNMISFLAHNGALEYAARDGFSKLESGTAEEKAQVVRQLGTESCPPPASLEAAMEFHAVPILDTYKIGSVFGVKYSVDAQPSAYHVTMNTPVGRLERTVPIKVPDKPLISCMIGYAQAAESISTMFAQDLTDVRKRSPVEVMANSLVQEVRGGLSYIQRRIGR